MNVESTPLMRPGQWHVTIVTSLLESDNELTMSFFDGKSATLSKLHPDFGRLRQRMSFSHRRRYPIALFLAEDRQVVESGMVDYNEVSEVDEDARYPHLIRVRFQGSSGYRYLSKTHPSFLPMINDISQAMAAGQPIWCILVAGTIIDLKLSPPEEDEAACQWMKQHGEEPTAEAPAAS
jgi:hypothetical protein